MFDFLNSLDLYQIAVNLAFGAAALWLCRWWIKGRKCKSQEQLDGKTVIITGANSGVGLWTACDLVKRNARVILACRSIESGNNAIKFIRTVTKNGQLVVRKLDLTSLDSVREFARKTLAEESRIDILINNAGTLSPPESHTKDGFEIHFGVNHLGHFLLTTLLLDRIKSSAPSRIVVVSSNVHSNGEIDFMTDFAHRTRAGGFKRYSNSKLANALFTRELAKRLEGTNVTAYCVHPGLVASNLFKTQSKKIPGILKTLLTPLGKFMAKTPEYGAQTSIYCAVDKSIAKDSGKYYVNVKETGYGKRAMNDKIARQLWEYSEELVEKSS